MTATLSHVRKAYRSAERTAKGAGPVVRHWESDPTLFEFLIRNGAPDTYAALAALALSLDYKRTPERQTATEYVSAWVAAYRYTRSAVILAGRKAWNPHKNCGPDVPDAQLLAELGA